MASPHVCPQCRQPLASDAPDGLCPQCLLKAATASAPTPSGDGLECDIIDIGDPVEVGKKLPQFEILQMLGRGGMGVVYQARQRQLDRMVAVKILPPVDALSADFVARFTREARALAKLNHPNIVSVFDFGEAGGLYYIVMELVDGTNLRELFETRKLTPAEALAIVPKICDALQYAHEEGIVHRDIKPENILIDRKGRVKIADFGLAKLLCREALDMTLTLSGTSLGTVRYMAPEQMDKPETVDHRADLYSLGVVIYEMLTGDVPVGRYDLPSQKAHVDVRLDEIVLHALEREPARRYQHASEVRDDVEKVTSTADIPTRKRPQAAAPIPPPAGEAEAPTGGHPFFKGSWILLPMAAIFLAQFNRWGNQALFYFAIACVVLPILSRLRWRLGEIVCAVMVALALICGAITGLRELAHGYAVPNPFGVPVTLVASVCALGTFLQHQLARPAGVRAMLPELAFTVLAACAGTLPWTMLIFPIPGWDFWQGAAFAALNFTAALFLLMLSGARWGRVRAVAMLVTGLAGFTLVMLFNVLPVHVIGSRGFLGGGPDILYQKPGLPGLYLSAVLSLLIAISGVLEVRRWLSSTTDSSSSPGPQAVRIQGLIQTGTWIAIACAILFSPSDDQPAGSPNRSASATPPPATAATADPRFHIQQDRSQLPPAPTPGRQDYAFKFSGPSDHTMNLWLEVWRDGKLEIVSSFDFLARPKIGTPLEAALQLTTMNGDVASVENKGKVRFDWTMHCGGAGGTGENAGAWRPNIFQDLGSVTSTWDYAPKDGWHPRPGETVTLLAIVGYRLTSLSEFVPGWSEVELLKGWPSAAILIRARFNPARAGELGDGPGLGNNVTDREFVTRKLALFALGKQLAVDLRAYPSVSEAHAALVAAATKPEGRSRAAEMVKEFNTGDMGYTTSLASVIEPMRQLKYRIDKASPEEIVSALEKFITDLTDLPRGTSVTWYAPRPIETGPNGPQLTAETVRKLKLPPRQVEEANKVMQKYAVEAFALERRHTKIKKNDQGHVIVDIEPFSPECLELAAKMVAELGGIVPQDILPAIRPGALPGEIFRSAGECRHTIELWKQDGKYHREHKQSDWVDAPGMVRNAMSSTSSGPTLDVFYGDYRLYWTEE